MRQYNKAKQKMINVDDVVKESITILTETNWNWPENCWSSIYHLN